MFLLKIAAAVARIQVDVSAESKKLSCVLKNQNHELTDTKTLCRAERNLLVIVPTYVFHSTCSNLIHVNIKTLSAAVKLD